MSNEIHALNTFGQREVSSAIHFPDESFLRLFLYKVLFSLCLPLNLYP